MSEETELLTADVIAEARAICVERGIDPDQTGFSGRKIKAGDQSPFLSDIGRSYDPTLPAYAGYMDEAADRLLKRIRG